MAKFSLSLDVRSLYTRSKYRENSPAELKEREAMFRENLKNELSLSKNFTSEQWDQFAEKLINRDLYVMSSYVNPKNVDGVILRLCAEFELNEIGRAYFDYMKKKNKSLNDGVLSRYLSLCAQDKKYALEHENEIIAVYKQLRKSSAMEALVAERCISVVCLFEKHWKDALYLLEQVKESSSPSPSSYCAIIEACFNFGNVQLGWELMRTLSKTSTAKPRADCYIAYIRHCERRLQYGQFRVEDLEELFIFLEEFHLNFPNTEAVNKLKNLISSLSNEKSVWSLDETFIMDNAVCRNCRRTLEPVRISTAEFNDLCRHFVKKAVIGNNVFLKSNPQEIEKFKWFLEKSQPYDIVIDGLNVAYTRGKKGPEVLAGVVSYVFSIVY